MPSTPTVVAMFRPPIATRLPRHARWLRSPATSLVAPSRRDKAFADGLAAYLEAFTRAAATESRAEAIRMFAALFGALSLARSIAGEKPELSNEILAAVAAAIP